MKPTELENTANQEESEKLARLAKSFMSEETKIGDYQIRKPSIAGLQILARTKNKFACGFAKDEILSIFPNGDPGAARKNNLEFEVSAAGLLSHLNDLCELIVLCSAKPDQIREWFSNPKSFDDAVFEFADNAELPGSEIIRLFNDAFLLIAEIQDAEVEAVKKPVSKNTPKKKGPRARRSSSATSGKSRKT